MAAGTVGSVGSAAVGGIARSAGLSRLLLGVILLRAVGLVAVLVSLGVVVAPRMSENRYDVWAAALGLGAVVAAWSASAALLRTRARVPDRWWDATAAGLCLLLTSVAGVVAYSGAYRTGWDASMIKYAATRPPDAKVVTYFSIYPNNLPFLAVARTLARWTAGTGIDYEAAFAALNTASFLVTAVAVYLTVRRIAGPARGVLALVLLGVLLGSTPWLSVAYTDAAALWAPIAAVALVTASLHPRQGPVGTTLLAAGAGVALAVGYLLKTTPVVGLVALVAALAVAAIRQEGFGGRLLTIGSCAVAAFLVAVLALGVWVRAADGVPALNQGLAATPLTYVAAGVRTQTWTRGSTAYGAYDRVVTQQTHGRDTAAQNAVASRFIEQEWQSRGLAGMAGFAVDKTLFNWGDGTFWARGEGGDATAPALRTGSMVDSVMSWTAPGGRWFGLHVLLAQVTWTAVLLALGVGLLLSAYRPEFLLMALTIAGIAAFTLLFQGRSRYLIGHVPVVVALAACVLPRPRLPRTGLWRGGWSVVRRGSSGVQ
jgi:hypothetical protein